MTVIGIVLTIIGAILCPLFTLGCVLIHFDLMGVGVCCIVLSAISLTNRLVKD